MARPQSTEKQISGAKPTESERRQLTVLSCNLVGSAALAVHCDPEDLSSVIRNFQASGAAVIERMGGTIATLTADAILAYFGYPESTEHDAERAVHAGLDLVAKVSQLVSPTNEPLQVRVGVATGSAVVSREQALGEPLAVAAGLCKAAAPNSVLVAASTRKLLGGIFVFENMELYQIAEVSDAVSACRVVRERRVESRFKARQSDEITQLVGRDRELRQLSALWDRAKRCGRPSCPRGRRAWHRKIASLRSFYGLYFGRAARDHPISMLSVPWQQSVLSDHQPARAGNWVRAIGYARDQTREIESRIVSGRQGDAK